MAFLLHFTRIFRRLFCRLYIYVHHRILLWCICCICTLHGEVHLDRKVVSHVMYNTLEDQIPCSI